MRAYRKSEDSSPDATSDIQNPTPAWVSSPRDEGVPGHPRCYARVFDMNRRDFRQCRLYAKTLHHGYPVCNRHASKLDPIRKSIIALD